MKYEFCPNGNYWNDITGVFDTRTYMFCDCKLCGGRIYELRPFDVTKKLRKGIVEEKRKDEELRKIRFLVTKDNMERVKSIFNPSSNK